MNYYSAIANIEAHKGKVKYTMLHASLETAIEALKIMPEYERLKERDRAKSPEVDEEMGYFICPSCQSAIGYTDEKETHKFCLKCGQRIDWAEQE